MDGTVWMMFALTEGAVNVSPGPAVLLVVSQSLRYGWGKALWSALGILAANIIFFAISGTGLGALLAASDRIFTMVKWAGAGYLLYLGVCALLLRPVLTGAGSGGATAAPSPGIRALFFRGLFLQLANPKALLFFVAILPQFIDRSRPVPVQIGILVATSLVMEFVIFAAYGTAAERAAELANQPRFAAATTRISGALLVAAALGLARLER